MWRYTESGGTTESGGIAVWVDRPREIRPAFGPGSAEAQANVYHTLRRVTWELVR